MSAALRFDDAAVFPPGNRALEEALEAHRRHRLSPYADQLGPLVVGADHLDQLRALAAQSAQSAQSAPAGDVRHDREGGDGVVALAVVVPDAAAACAAVDAVAALPGFDLAALEVTSAAVVDLATTLASLRGVRVYVELPRDPGGVRDVVGALAGSTYRAKVRTGGIEASLYPSEAELAATVVALARSEVLFKATAGLHHALRCTEAGTGFEQHGFVNLAAATEAAGQGADVEEVAAILAERDRTRLPGRIPATLLRSVGTCAVVDTIAEYAEWEAVRA